MINRENYRLISLLISTCISSSFFAMPCSLYLIIKSIYNSSSSPLGKASIWICMRMKICISQHSPAEEFSCARVAKFSGSALLIMLFLIGKCGNCEILTRSQTMHSVCSVSKTFPPLSVVSQLARWHRFGAGKHWNLIRFICEIEFSLTFSPLFPFSF